MIRYRRSQLKMGAIDTPEMRAVVQFVVAVETGVRPSQTILATVVYCLRKATANKALPQMVSALKIVKDFDTGKAPRTKDLNRVKKAFQEIFGGVQPAAIWGNHIGLGKVVGRQTHHGFTPSDVVSAYIELQRRRNGSDYGALELAKSQAADSFIDLTGKDKERQIDRDWAKGRTTVEPLSTEQLEQLVAPHKLR